MASQADMKICRETLSGLGEPETQAAEKFFPLIYSELRRIAGSRMKFEPGEKILQPTALVNEVYMRKSPANRKQRSTPRRTSLQLHPWPCNESCVTMLVHARQRNAAATEFAKPSMTSQIPVLKQNCSKRLLNQSTHLANLIHERQPLFGCVFLEA